MNYYNITRDINLRSNNVEKNIVVYVIYHITLVLKFDTRLRFFFCFLASGRKNMVFYIKINLVKFPSRI